jgi:Domain of unknown function (DUF1707)
MTWPGDDIAADAGGHGHLRASHADRERAIGTLTAAYVQGMLTKDELDLRVGQAFASRTYSELAVLTADLPAGPASAAPPRRAAQPQARRPMSDAAKAGVWLVIAIAVPMALSLPAGGALFLLFTPFYFMALAFLGAEVVASRHKKRSHRGQVPPRPASGAGGQASPSCRQPIRAGGFRLAMTATGTAPTLRPSFAPACCPASEEADDAAQAQEGLAARHSTGKLLLPPGL